jgi:hypothetical protein
MRFVDMRAVVQEEVQVDAGEIPRGAGEPQGAGRLNKEKKDEKGDNINYPKKTFTCITH